jgi:hypothetical protein
MGSWPILVCSRRSVPTNQSGALLLALEQFPNWLSARERSRRSRPESEHLGLFFGPFFACDEEEEESLYSLGSGVLCNIWAFFF